MSYRLSKIVTRTGDDGCTQLGAGSRLPKDHPQIAVMGTLDELNSAIGLVLAHQPLTLSVKNCLIDVQQELFNLGGELCPPHHQVITDEKVSQLEKIIEEWNATLPPLKEFIIPGGNLKSATCHLARTISRRAEREAVTLFHHEKFNPVILKYLNRLSDVLFVAARMLAKETGEDEILWVHEKQK